MSEIYFYLTLAAEKSDVEQNSICLYYFMRTAVDLRSLKYVARADGFRDAFRKSHVLRRR